MGKQLSLDSIAPEPFRALSPTQYFRGEGVSPELFTFINRGVMTVVVWIIPLSFIPFFIWLERKGSAIIQDRVGPNRTEILGIRLLGFIQNFADTLKLLMKENLDPRQVHGFYFLLAPFWSMTVALLPLLVIPLAAPMDFLGQTVPFPGRQFRRGGPLYLRHHQHGGFRRDPGGLVLQQQVRASWGALRSSAQMISYELSMGLALVGLLMVYQGVAWTHRGDPGKALVRSSGRHPAPSRDGESSCSRSGFSSFSSRASPRPTATPSTWPRANRNWWRAITWNIPA